MAADILVVDDDERMVMGLKELLEEEGYSVTSCTSSRSALEAVRGRSFAIALVDLVMPGMDGMELLKEILALSPETKVIIITGFATVESAVEAMKAGACDYISKPFKAREIESVVKRTLEEMRFEKEMLKAGRRLPHDRLLQLLSNPIRRRVVSYLAAKKRSRFTDIKNALGIEDPTKLSFHLRELKSNGLVAQDRERAYALSATGRRAARVLEELEKIAY